MVKTVVTRASTQCSLIDPVWESAVLHDSDHRPGKSIAEENMTRKNKRKKTTVGLPILNANAAGIDIGATEMYVAVPPDRDPDPV